jgi:hypothetical protein
MNKVYIILFKDGTQQFFPRRQRQVDFQEGATIWVCKDNTSVIELCDWASHSFMNTRFIQAADWVK